MSTPLSALQSVEAYRQLDAEDRLRLADDLAARLGDGFSAPHEEYGRERLIIIDHAATQSSFLAVPGGTFEMGLSDRDVEEVRAAAQGNPEVEQALVDLMTRCRPGRAVDVRPFLCRGMPLSHGAASDLLGTFADADAPLLGYGVPSPDLVVVLTAEEAQRALALSGFRLVSEAEYEWIARDLGNGTWINGGAAEKAMLTTGRPPEALADDSACAFFSLEVGEWVADAWHDNYVGAPPQANPWGAPAKLETYRGSARRTFPWQHPAEALLGLAAFRGRAGGEYLDAFALRFAIDLPLD